MAWWNCILLVEDDVDLLLAWQEALELEGHHVVLARDGAEALELLRQGLRPALILMDLRMPRMDAWTFRRRQRADPALASIPVLILYSHDEAPQTVEVLEVEGFLRKPVDLDVLLRAVAPYVTPEGAGAHPLH
jgi:two-component system, chemotaxis family, chemotaxis protein CheY